MRWPESIAAKPLVARYKQEPADFRVQEILGFDADGEGEHWLLAIEKEGHNTEFVASALARHAGVAPVAVGFAGRKDRHARVVQHFTVHAPRLTADHWRGFSHPGVRILSVARHRRKLPRGAHRGNAFVVRLRQVRGEEPTIAAWLERIAREGFPNYFGAQRFGRDAANLEAAVGRSRRSRRWREFALSAARAALFNEILAQRVAAGTWDRLLAGDLATLDGRRSFFKVLDPTEASIETRRAEGFIHPSGALWGRGPTPASGAPGQLEAAVAAAHPDWAAACEREGLRQERRALRVIPAGLRFTFERSDTLILECVLARGSYMTVLLEAMGATCATEKEE
ncbi:MAG: tRNA pseudouridine synthase D [Lysobacterales bacterium]|jgi:tRNA pseudouridine13 synthase|nr:MAG: tRNA pseudouridine synthase D [Xanthomonadales bacterium]